MTYTDFLSSPFPVVNNERVFSDELTIGSNATPQSTFTDRIFSFNITMDDDMLKEGAETFTLTLKTNDSCVWLGRDFALIEVQANGGKPAPCCRQFQCHGIFSVDQMQQWKSLLILTFK